MYSGWFAVATAAAIAAFVGCSETRTTRPPVHDSTMVEILIELHLAIARAEITQRVPPGIRDSIFATYQVDSTAFDETLSHYAAEPEKYAQIYSLVLDKLNSERIPLVPGAPVDPTLELEPPGIRSQRLSGQ